MKKNHSGKSLSVPEINDEGLGKYINGYDNYGVSPHWSTVFFLILMSLFAIFFIFLFVCNILVLEAASGEGVGFFSLFFGIVFAVFAANTYVKHYLRRARVLVYENGFIWETSKRNGETIKLDKINFDDVDGISFPKTKKFVNGQYVATRYTLTVRSKGRQVWDVSGTYKNLKEDDSLGNWEFKALEAIMNSWNRIGLSRLNEELSKNGFVRFRDSKRREIEVGKTYIKVDDKVIQKEHVKYQFRSVWLCLHDDTKKNHWYKKYEISINVNEMTNSRLFLSAVGSLLDIK